MLQQNPLMLGMDQETVRYFEQMALVASKMVAVRLEEPDIDEFCQLGRDFFNEYAGKFDFMVPPKRAIQIKKFFKKLKSIDPTVFKQLKPMRTQMGLLSEDSLKFFLMFAEHVLTNLKQTQSTTGGTQSLFFMLLQALDSEVSQHMPEMPADEPANHDSIVAHIVTDPEKMRQLQLWLQSFIFFYILMRREHFSTVFAEHPNGSLSIQEIMDVRWADAYAIEDKIEQYLLEHAAK